MQWKNEKYNLKVAIITTGSMNVAEPFSSILLSVPKSASEKCFREYLTSRRSANIEHNVFEVSVILPRTPHRSKFAVIWARTNRNP